MNVPISYVSIPVKSDDELGVEIVEWPVLNPVDFVPKFAPSLFSYVLLLFRFTVEFNAGAALSSGASFRQFKLV